MRGPGRCGVRLCGSGCAGVRRCRGPAVRGPAVPGSGGAGSGGISEVTFGLRGARPGC